MRTKQGIRAKSPFSGMRAVLWLAFLISFGWLPESRADLQFDVFLGYDNKVHENGWFPAVFEIKNDGAPFIGTIELSSGNLGSSQTRRKVVELPYDTTKIVSIPVFAGAGQYGRWQARLLDERGRAVAEVPQVMPRTTAWQSLLIGAVPRNTRGLPSFPKIRNNAQQEFQPAVADLRLSTFPNSALEMEGLDALYVNSERLVDLEDRQVAIQQWLNGGGHLVVAVEQPAEIQAVPWLRRLLPIRFSSTRTLSIEGRIHDWLTQSRAGSASSAQPGGMNAAAREIMRRYGVSAEDSSAGGPLRGVTGSDALSRLKRIPEFDDGELLVSTGTVAPDAKVLMGLDGVPLMVRGNVGRGRVTVLTFSPEREPFLSWEHRDWFFTRVFGVSPEWFSTDQFDYYSGMNIDGVFGAMIDSRQVRKLPVSWLLGLLVVYLVVIGPFDQYFLKKINRQMLTWVTFPFYVVMFSCLIYFIGYKLRAGDTEWNELHVVDLLPHGGQVDWRGRTYTSIYSPVNQRYDIANERYPSTLRGEVQSSGRSQETSEGVIEQMAKGFRARVFVPVWTSQLFVSDWYQPGDMAIEAEVRAHGDQLEFSVDNRLNNPIESLQVVAQGKLFDLGKLDAGTSQTFSRRIGSDGTDLNGFINSQKATMFQSVQQRGGVFGGGQSGRLPRIPAYGVAVSFVSQLGQFDLDDQGTLLEIPHQRQPGRPVNQYFLAPPGMDLTELAARGHAVVFAWIDNLSLVERLNQFEPRISHKTTLLRLAVPVEEAGDTL